MASMARRPGRPVSRFTSMSPDASSAKPVTTDAPERERYEAHVDDELAGVLVYKQRRDRIALIHTEVRPDFEGRGIASAIVRFALADARAHGWKVIPSCPYVQSYLERHPEERDLVAG